MTFHPRPTPPYLATTYCPDCGELIRTADFISHRENAHPPTLLTVAAVGGIKSQETVHGQPRDDEE